MAVLRLLKESKTNQLDDNYFPADLEISDSEEFFEFRRAFYGYQYKFLLRAKDVPQYTLEFYKTLATGSHLFYGVAEDRALEIVKYSVDLHIDLRLSKRKAKDVFDKSAKLLWQQIESIYNDLRSNEEDFVSEYPQTRNGRKVDTRKLFEMWDTALRVYDLYEEQEVKNWSAISRELDWFDIDNRQHASEEVSHYYKYATKLINAARKGKLYEEACKPMTEGKKRR